MILLVIVNAILAGFSLFSVWYNYTQLGKRLEEVDERERTETVQNRLNEVYKSYCTKWLLIMFSVFAVEMACTMVHMNIRGNSQSILGPNCYIIVAVIAAVGIFGGYHLSMRLADRMYEKFNVGHPITRFNSSRYFVILCMGFLNMLPLLMVL